MNLRVRDAAACRDFYQQHFGFHPAFEADGGYFIRNEDGFLLALIPADPHQELPFGFHIGFGGADADEVLARYAALAAAGVRTSDVQDFRPGEIGIPLTNTPKTHSVFLRSPPRYYSLLRSLQL